VKSFELLEFILSRWSLMLASEGFVV